MAGEVVINEIDYTVDYVESVYEDDVTINSLIVDFIGEGYTGTVVERNLEVNITTEVLSINLVEGFSFPSTPGWSTRTTLLEITGHIEANTPFSVISSGVGYIFSRSEGDLRADADEFLSSEAVQVLVNGVEQVKAIDAYWVSRYSFYLGYAVDTGDQIKIVS